MHRDPAAGRGPLTLDDWKWVADQFNQIGEKVSASGMKFAYHNHTPEFTPIDGTMPWDLLEKNTDPAKVNFEMDCGWVIVAGQDPIPYLKKYGKRIVMFYTKDLQRQETAIGSSRDGRDRPTSRYSPPPRERAFVTSSLSRKRRRRRCWILLAIDAKYMAQFS